jgi:hypothetical protein
MGSTVLSLVSLAIALVAATVAAWQARFNVQTAERSRTLPAVTEVFREYRSEEFVRSIRYLIRDIPEARGAEGFGSFPDEWQYNAYRVCYLFDYMGLLTAFGLVKEELVVSLFGSGIMRVWRAIEQHINMEREYRLRTYPPDAPPGFLVYYEHLVRRIIDCGGKDAALLIQRRTGLRRLAHPVSETDQESTA